ncbi:MAG: TolC family protein [Bacteroidota bacterium]|nr:TolC family protein [Bacteroidota bacterium]
MNQRLVKATVKLCATTLLFACRLSLYAQPSHHALSLQELVASALKYSPVLQSRQAYIKSSEQDIISTRNAYLPTAVVGDEALIASDNSLPGSYLSMGIIPSTSSGIRPDNTAQAASGNFALFMSQYEIASFGYKNAQIQNAEAEVSLRNSDLNRESYLLKWRISKLYFTLLQQQLQQSIEEQNTKRYEDLFAVVRAVSLSGLKPGADSSQALAELSETKVDVNNAVKQTLTLKQELAYLSGIRADSIAIDTSEQQHQQTITQLLQSGADTTANPLLEYYTAEQQLLQSNEAIVQRSFRPHLMLTGMAWARGSSIDANNKFQPLGSVFDNQRYNYLAGVSLFYNLFSGIQKKSRLAASRYNSEAGADELEGEKQSLQNINNEAEEAIRIASENLAQLPVQLRAANDAFNQKTAQYKAGISNLVDLTTATYVLYRAQTEYAQALNDWFLANVDKAAVTGRLNLFIQSLNK